VPGKKHTVTLMGCPTPDKINLGAYVLPTAQQCPLSQVSDARSHRCFFGNACEEIIGLWSSVRMIMLASSTSSRIGTMSSRIPLLPEDALPDLVELGKYLKGVPDSMRAYAHRPEVMKVFVQLELELMTRGLVPTVTKVRVAYITGRLNGGVYTASHTGGRLMRDFGVTRDDLARMLNEDPPTDDPALKLGSRKTEQERLAKVA
jgi:hypothetical protein